MTTNIKSSSKIINFMALLFLVVTATKIWPSDRWPVISLLSYAPPLLMLLALLLAFVVVRLLHVRMRGIWLMVLIISGILNLAFFVADNRPFFRSNRAVTGEQKPTRLFHWNVRGSRNSPNAILPVILSLHPDIICLNEPKPRNDSPRFPDYAPLIGRDWTQTGHGNVLLISTFPMQKIDVIDTVGMKGVFAEIRAENLVRILLVDVARDVEYNRVRGMRSLADFLRKHADALPDIILGDFNTPSGSYSLTSSIPVYYRDAYYLAGNSIGYTWRTWLPVVRIDLLYAGGSTTVFDHKIGYSRRSDHAWQFITFSTIH